MPNEPAVLVLGVRLEDAAGVVLQRNFTTFIVEGDVLVQATLADGRGARVARVPASAVRDARWTLLEVPYQTLINLYLRDCAATRRRPAMNWRTPRKGAA